MSHLGYLLFRIVSSFSSLLFPGCSWPISMDVLGATDDDAGVRPQFFKRMIARTTVPAFEWFHSLTQRNDHEFDEGVLKLARTAFFLLPG